jgi:hypothetical protein
MSVWGQRRPARIVAIGKNATTMSAISIRTRGMTKDDTFVICACSLGIILLDLDVTVAPHATCGDTTKP